MPVFPRNDGPLVYLSFGSLGAMDVGLIERMLAVFADAARALPGQCRRLPRHLPRGARQCLSRRLVSAALGRREVRPVHPSRRQQQFLRGAALRRAVADHALLLGRP